MKRWLFYITFLLSLFLIVFLLFKLYTRYQPYDFVLELSESPNAENDWNLAFRHGKLQKRSQSKLQAKQAYELANTIFIPSYTLVGDFPQTESEYTNWVLLGLKKILPLSPAPTYRIDKSIPSIRLAEPVFLYSQVIARGREEKLNNQETLDLKSRTQYSLQILEQGFSENIRLVILDPYKVPEVHLGEYRYVLDKSRRFGKPSVLYFSPTISGPASLKLWSEFSGLSAMTASPLILHGLDSLDAVYRSRIQYFSEKWQKKGRQGLSRVLSNGSMLEGSNQAIIYTASSTAAMYQWMQSTNANAWPEVLKNWHTRLDKSFPGIDWQTETLKMDGVFISAINPRETVLLLRDGEVRYYKGEWLSTEEESSINFIDALRRKLKRVL